MPNFGILVTEDEHKWWKYTLIIDHKPLVVSTPYTTPQAALAAALFEANRRGYYQ